MRIALLKLIVQALLEVLRLIEKDLKYEKPRLDLRDIF